MNGKNYLDAYYSQISVNELNKAEFNTLVQQQLQKPIQAQDMQQVYQLFYNKSNFVLSDVMQTLQFMKQTQQQQANLKLAAETAIENYATSMEQFYDRKMQNYLIEITSQERTHLFNDVFEYLYQAVSRPDVDLPSSNIRSMFTDAGLGIWHDEDCFPRNDGVRRIMYREMVNQLEHSKLDEGSLRRRDIQKLFLFSNDKKRATVEKKSQKESLVREMVRRLVLTTERAKRARRAPEADLEQFKIKTLSLNFESQSFLEFNHEDCHVIETSTANSVSEMIDEAKKQIKHEQDSVVIVNKKSLSTIDFVLYLNGPKRAIAFKVVSVPAYGNTAITIKEELNVAALEKPTEVVFLALQHTNLAVSNNTVVPTYAHGEENIPVSISFVCDYFLNDMHMIARHFRKLEEAFKELEELKAGKDEYDMSSQEMSKILDNIGYTKETQEALKWQLGVDDD